MTLKYPVDFIVLLFVLRLTYLRIFFLRKEEGESRAGQMSQPPLWDRFRLEGYIKVFHWII